MQQLLVGGSLLSIPVISDQGDQVELKEDDRVVANV